MLIKMLEMLMAARVALGVPDCRQAGSFSFQGFKIKGQLPQSYWVRKF
jgi:hypothetical protein